jgi:mono/diheme cytochrome c family protein
MIRLRGSLTATLGAFLLTVAWGARGSLVQRVPASAAKRENPFEGQEMARRAGAKLYARQCTACHGRDREGIGKAPPLDQPEVLNAAPATLFWILRNGSLRRGMPSFAHLPAAERWQIITFLRSR